jgi:hypothetical protein
VRLVKHVSDNADGQAAFDWPTSVAASARVLGDWLVKNARR